MTRFILALSLVWVSLHARAELFTLDWEDNILTISRGDIPGGSVKVWYIEAYCRGDAHDADWSAHTVIPHTTVMASRKPDGSQIELRSLLDNDCIARHLITAEHDAVRFHVLVHNPTAEYADVIWAQPCIRVGEFTGTADPDRTDTYKYLANSFVFIDGKAEHMPTRDWATEARYTPGQVWRAPHVPAKDVNPRPLNPNIPSNGLIGCLSADKTWVLATAWEPYHELFQGVITCLHSDFHIGGLDPKERKIVQGAIYLFEGSIDNLLTKYASDFPLQAAAQPDAQEMRKPGDE